MRRLALGCLHAGTITVVLGASAWHAQRNDYAFTGTSRFAWALAYLGLLLVASYGSGLPDLAQRRGRLATSAVAAGGAALGISALQLALGSALLPRSVVFGSALALTAWWWFVAAATSSATRRAGGRDRVAFVGSTSDAITLDGDIDMHPEQPSQLVATMTTDQARPHVGGQEPLVDLVIAQDATVLVLGREAQDDPAIVAQASTLHESGIRVRTLTAFYEEWLGKLPIAELERISLMFDIREVHGEAYGRVKRLFDVLAGMVGTLSLLVAIPLVFAANLVANRGPLFYRQERVGRAAREFRIIKFRTMRRQDGGLANEWTTEDDPRITPFGRVMRRTHLDELPQFLNILLGDLSVIGPRPEQPQYVASLVQKLPFYDLRHLVRPGLTGWAQVKYGYAGNERDALEKLQYEFFYLGHQGFVFDARIVARTLRSVLGTKGR